MDAFLGKITSHAMNYAIRTGIGITASYAIKQTSRLLKTVDDTADRRELQELQEQLNTKIQIISPSIDMIELISARGNTTLESAVSLTKALRRDIQALGLRLSKAASAEETSRKARDGAKSRDAHEAEIQLIVYDIKKLIARIENARHDITLAITTSGARLSTSLPATVSPSRMLQASTFITAGDMQYSINPGIPVQIGPAFILSLYMLFSGHSHRVYEDGGTLRGATMKEVLHKARVKLMRVPIESWPDNHNYGKSILQSIESENDKIHGEGLQNEFSYRLEIIEDLDDDRMHSFDDGEAPGPYGDVQLAGIREFLPIHQISKIFYATTGKILGIGNEGEPNSPVLLLKRDINAQAPRTMMNANDTANDWDDDEDEESNTRNDEDDDDDIDEQIRRESSIALPGSPAQNNTSTTHKPWSLPLDLDPEWLAVSVYTEEEPSSSEDEYEEEQELEHDSNEDSAYVSHRPSSSGVGLNQGPLTLPVDFSRLNLDPESSPPQHQSIPSPVRARNATSAPSTALFPAIRSSLSLLEMLIRLTSLQQFQQTSHLSVPDELLTFFLEESSASGTGAEEQRRLLRGKAQRTLGFDPYDESPIKRHGEDYQYQNGQNEAEHEQGWSSYSRGGTPSEFGGGGVVSSPQRYNSDDSNHEGRNVTPQRTLGTPQTQAWLQKSSRQNSPLPALPNSPISPYRPQQRRTNRPVERVMKEVRGEGQRGGSPLAQHTQAPHPDSTLGLSPVSSSSVPNLNDK